MVTGEKVEGFWMVGSGYIWGVNLILGIFFDIIEIDRGGRRRWLMISILCEEDSGFTEVG